MSAGPFRDELAAAREKIAQLEADIRCLKGERDPHAPRVKSILLGAFLLIVTAALILVVGGRRGYGDKRPIDGTFRGIATAPPPAVEIFDPPIAATDQPVKAAAPLDSANPYKGDKKCNCSPGDPLCSCL